MALPVTSTNKPITQSLDILVGLNLARSIEHSGDFAYSIEGSLVAKNPDKTK